MLNTPSDLYIFFLQNLNVHVLKFSRAKSCPIFLVFHLKSILIYKDIFHYRLYYHMSKTNHVDVI